MKAAFLIRAALVLAIALAVKRYYSSASTAELDWILRPTAALVEHTTGRMFDREPDLGFVHRPLAFAISKPCAGLNFAIIAFVMLAFSTAWPLLLCGGVAFVSTLVINAARISLTVVRMASPFWRDLPIDSARLHRIEGIAVYFVGLSCLYLLTSKRRDLRVPLVCYLSVTLAVPLLNGGLSQPHFLEHACLVLALPLLVLLMVGRDRGARAAAGG